MRLMWAVLLLLGVSAPSVASDPKSGSLAITAWRVEGTSMESIDGLMEHMDQKRWRIGGKSLWAVDASLVKEGFSQSFVVEKDPTLWRPGAWLPSKVKLISERLGPPVVDTFRMRVREEYDESVDIQLAAGAPRPTILRMKWDERIPGTSDYLVVTTAENKPVCGPLAKAITRDKQAGCKGLDRLWFYKHSMMVMPVPQEDGSWLVVAFEQE